ncbi:hypothetical protein [Paenibacillus amylolyticus]|uniref:hypothetical protein n=1 Tax=Paenibacillus amylolyticus TaxID=1451 RepID=UPI000B8360F4|nr:hypothetical protein [Paenibacillus amylolyticus]
MIQTTGTVVTPKKKQNQLAAPVAAVQGMVTPKPTPTVSTLTTPGMGNGGANYNTGDQAMKLQIAQNQAKIGSDAGYKDNEISRALQVIQNRQVQGQDTSAQQKYLTTNLGYKPPGAAATTPNPTAVNTPSANTQMNNTQQGMDLLSQMKAIANREQSQFSYDPNADPLYQAALKRAQSNIDSGNSATQAELNRRGILNSTITSDRMSELAAQEMGRVETDVMPSLMQQAYQQYMDQEALKQQQFGNLGALSQSYLGEDQRQFGNRVAEGELTGNYLPERGQVAIDAILKLKEQAEAPGITAAERAKLSAQADGYRAQLLQMNIDPSAYASSVNANTARTNNAGIRTLGGQTMDLNNKQANLGAAATYMDATGKVVTPQSDWSGYARQAANPNTPLTQSGQNQAFNQQQVGIDNQFRSDQFAYQQARDAVADSQWSAQFEQNATQFGLNYALQQLSQQDDSAYRNAMLAISNDENSRAWLGLGSTQPTEYNGMNANQVLSALQSQYIDPTTEKYATPKDAATREQIYQQVAGYGLPQGQDDQVMLSMGLTTKEIQEFDKKYIQPSTGTGAAAAGK